MKSVVMFVAGAVLASGLVMLMMRRSDAPAAAPASAAQTAAPVEQVTAAPPQPEPVAVSQPETAKPSPMPPLVESVREPRAARKRAANRQVPVQSPPPSTPVAIAQNTPPPAPAPQVDPTPVPAAPQPSAQEPIVQQPKPEPAPPPQPKTVTIPAGTLLTVRVDQTLRSDRNQNGDSFRAALDQPLVIDGFVIAERGSRVEGRVSEVDPGGRVRGVSQMTLELVRLTTSDGQQVRLRTESFARRGEKDTKGDAAKIGVAAGIGAAIGAIAGGGKGAAIGAGVGGAAGAGGVMATRGKAAEIPAETRLSFRLSEPITITEKL